MELGKQIIEAAASFFKEKPQVLVVYLYGSRITGKARAKSDLDIAVVVDEASDIRYEDLYYRLARIIPEREIDLRIVTKEASPTFLFQIVRDGKRIYERDVQERVRFEAKVLLDFYDSQHIRNIYDHYLKQAFS